jgi:hypothetical protein
MYSQLFAVGVKAIADQLPKMLREPSRADWAVGTVTAMVLAVPLYYGNGLLFGAHGEITPSQYPTGWYAADRVLVADTHHGRTLFLPWHEYMAYSFIRNQNAIVAPPAPAFFSVPIVASADPEVSGVASPKTTDQISINQLVSAGSGGPWAQKLTSLGIQYVLLARELDWQSYSFLDSQPGLVKIADYGSIVIYRIG